MIVTEELLEKINKLSAEKRKQFERYVDFLLEEAKQGKTIDKIENNDFENGNREIDKPVS